MSKNILKTMLSHAGIILSDSVNIEYTDAGWRIRGLDPSKIAFIEINVWSKSMDSYEFEPYDPDTGGKPQMATVPFNKLYEALAVLPDDSTIEVTDDRALFLLDSGKYHIKIREDSIDTQISMPNVVFDDPFVLNTNDLSKMLVSAKNIRDEISFRTGPDGLTISITSDTAEGMEYTDPEITSEDERSSKFPLDFVVDSFRGMKGNVLVGLKSDFPLKLTCNEPFTTVFLLAPRIESEE